MTQTQPLTTDQTQLLLRALRTQRRELRAQLDDVRTHIDAAGLYGPLEARDLAEADELDRQLDAIHTRIMTLEFSPAIQGEPQVMTTEQLETERQCAQFATRDNGEARQLTGLLPKVRTRRHRANPAGVRLALVQAHGYDDLLA